MDWRMAQGLTDAERAELRSITYLEKVNRGDVVVKQGDLADKLYLIEKGHFEVRLTEGLRREALINILASGDHFGELALLDNDGRRSATVKALEPGVLAFMHKPEFLDRRRRYPALTDVLLALAAERIRQLSAQVLDLASHTSAEDRIRRRLAWLADIYGPGDDRVVIPLSHRDVGSLAGVTRETATPALGKIRDGGAIELGRNRLVVLDRAKLATA